MRRLLFAIATVGLGLIATSADASVLVTWNTTGNLGTETSEPATFVAPGLVARRRGRWAQG